MAKKEADVVFVNEEKLKRAKDILALFTTAPKNDGQVEAKDRFSGFLKDAGLKHDDEGALQFIYEKLGGLVRTESEQKVAEKRAEEMKKARKKNDD